MFWKRYHFEGPNHVWRALKTWILHTGHNGVPTVITVGPVGWGKTKHSMSGSVSEWVLLDCPPTESQLHASVSLISIQTRNLISDSNHLGCYIEEEEEEKGASCNYMSNMQSYGITSSHAMTSLFIGKYMSMSTPLKNLLTWKSRDLTLKLSWKTWKTWMSSNISHTLS